MRVLIVLLLLVAVVCALRRPSNGKSLFSMRRVSPALHSVKQAAAAAVEQLNKRESKSMELVTILAAENGLRLEHHVFHLTLLVTDNGETAQRDATVIRVSDSEWTLEL